MKKTENQKGFTLLEILLVVALIGILAAIAIVAINPGNQVEDTDRSAREADVNTISSAISQFTIDNPGDLPGDLANFVENEGEICIEEGNPAEDNCDVNLDELVTDDYLAALPVDPRYEDDGAVDHIGYEIVAVDGTRVTVGSVNYDDITITR